MFKLVIGLLMLVALCAAGAPTRFRSAVRGPSAARVSFLARQQAAPSPAPTGYPAAGVTPEIPFDLPSSTAKPDVTYLPPDNTYGPPSPQPDATYGPPAPPTEAAVTPAAVYGPPDNTYLPPAESDTERDVYLEVDEEEPEPEAATVDEQQPTAPQPEVRDEPPQAEVEEPAGAEVEQGEEIFVAAADDGAVIAVSNSFDAQGSTNEAAVAAQQPARLVFQRFPQGRRRAPASVPVPARLIKMRRGAPTKLRQLPRVQPQPQPQGFSLVQQYTAW